MILELQFKIKNNPNYLEYLRTNSYWYKYLNRNPNNFKMFEEEVKQFKRNKLTNKIGETFKTIEMLQNVLSTMK